MIRFAVRRPVTIVTSFACIAVLGMTSAWRMPVELLPDVEFPRLEVSSLWPGASPDQVEALVTSPIEAAIQQVRAVRSVSSTSYAGRSAVRVEFEPGTDMQFARLDLVERLSALAPDLPAGMPPPEVDPWVPDEFAVETRALLAYTVAGPNVAGALREYAAEKLAPELAAVPGVARVEVSGGSDRQIRVRLDPERIAALGIFPEDVRRGIESGLNLAEPGGSFRTGGLEVALTIDDRADDVADLEALVLRPGGRDRPPTRLGDLARVEPGYADPSELYRLNGIPAVELQLYPRAGTNAIAVVDGVRDRLHRLGTELPIGYRVIEDYDGSEQVRERLAELRDRALLSTGCVLFVLLIAFRRARPALLVVASIATCMLTALHLMALMGLSLNLLTLAGLAMGVGLVADNAIVVLTAIEAEPDIASGSRCEREMAIRTGARQVVAPVIAADLTNLIVFVPFLFLQGELAAYYVPFAMTVGLALLASLVAAFTLIPALATRLRLQDVSASRPSRPVQQGSFDPGRPYRGAIGWTVRHPRGTVVGAALLFAASGWLFWAEVPRGRTWAAWWDRTYLSVQVTMPRGADLKRTDEIVRRIEGRVDRIPAVDRYAARVAPGHASIRISFPDSLARTAVPSAVKEALVGYSRTLGGAEIHVYGFGPTFFGAIGGPPTYTLQLKGYDYRMLDRMAADLVARLKRYPRIRDVDPAADGRWFEREKEIEMILTPDRLRLAAYGLPVEDLADRVSAYVSGETVPEAVILAGARTDLSVEVAGEDVDADAMLDRVVAADAETGVRIAAVAGLRERSTVGRIVREDQQYRRIVTYEFRGPRKLGDRVREAVVEATRLPAGYSLEAERPVWEYEKGEKGQLVLVVALALALVYMVTAALFESLKAPLVVLAAVPLALVGVFLVYAGIGETFTREAWIGVIMMTGIVVNNTILVVDRIGALRRVAGGPAPPLVQAAVQGTLERVRPILMTSGTTVLGLLPLVLFTDPETEGLWTALGLTTMAGLATSTLLVLVAIPALYVIVKPGGDSRRAACASHPPG